MLSSSPSGLWNKPRGLLCYKCAMKPTSAIRTSLLWTPSGLESHSIFRRQFIDVVKKRLDLSIEYLAENANEVQYYTLPSGMRVKIPKSDVGHFLHELYIELFERRRNISRILESLAGRDVRRALEMFVSLITSGHLREDQITSQVRGAGSILITEHNILKILMRTEYRFFSEQSGFVVNIFNFQNEWNKPNNFILSRYDFSSQTIGENWANRY